MSEGPRLSPAVAAPPQHAPTPASSQGAGSFASEEAFVEALRQGESAAAEELCLRHLARIRLVLRRVLGRDAELEDVLQEVVLRAIDSAPRFRGTSAQLHGWFTAIAVNTARELIRKRSRFRRFFAAAEDDVIDQTPAHLASMEEVQAVRQAYAVLDSMSVDDRIAYILRMLDRMTLEQIAEATNVSLSMARRRVDRAKRRFDTIARRNPALCELMGDPA